MTKTETTKCAAFCGDILCRDGCRKPQTTPAMVAELESMLSRMIKFIEEVVTCETNEEWMQGEELTSEARKLQERLTWPNQ